MYVFSMPLKSRDFKEHKAYRPLKKNYFEDRIVLLKIGIFFDFESG